MSEALASGGAGSAFAAKPPAGLLAEPIEWRVVDALWSESDHTGADEGAAAAPRREPTLFEEYYGVLTFDGTEAFRCIGCGGFGYVFEVVPTDDAYKDGRLTIDSAHSVVEGERCTLAMKQVYKAPSQAKDVWAREVLLMFTHRNDILADPAARATIVVPLDAFWKQDGDRILIRTVMNRAPYVESFGYKYGPSAENCTLPDHRSVPEVMPRDDLRGSGADLLNNPLLKKGAMADEQIHYVMVQLLTALAFMHRRDLIHRDIKAENMLLWGTSEEVDPSNGTAPLRPVMERRAGGPPLPWVKLADFGFARERKTDMTRLVGTKHFKAPELSRTDYTAAVDIFAAGCVLYQLITGERPQDLFASTRFGEGQRFPLAGTAAGSVLNPGSRFWPAFCLMVCRVPEHRPTAEQLLHHRAFFGTDPTPPPAPCTEPSASESGGGDPAECAGAHGDADEPGAEGAAGCKCGLVTAAMLRAL